MGRILILIFLFCFIRFIPPSYGYDPLDPNGNITLKWDILEWAASTCQLSVSITNYQLFRHIEEPGWKLSWEWTSDEVIWHMEGAEATEQGNCSRFREGNRPHSCEKKPVIVDLMPGAPYNLQVANCCKGGVLTSMLQDDSKYGAAFHMSVGVGTNSSNNGTTTPFNMPENFKLGLPGYTCGNASQLRPSRFPKDGGRRYTQALETFGVTCSYSQFRSASAPTCCVSLSAFYHTTIVPCPACSCGCQGLPGSKCVKPGEEPRLLQMPLNGMDDPRPVVRCTRHMCPIHVHWHVKESYRLYWRVKMTVTNLNFAKNYSQWNVAVVHPNLRSLTQAFSFNYKPLNQYGHINDSGMFYGIQYYNEMLMQTGKSGNVQSELLLNKDAGMFTFSEGWAFPRKISFNGHDCVMPPPDEFPRLPNEGNAQPMTMDCLMLFYVLLFTILFREILL